VDYYGQGQSEQEGGNHGSPTFGHHSTRYNALPDQFALELGERGEYVNSRRAAGFASSVSMLKSSENQRLIKR
jgi:hypothetical protein